MSQTLAREYGTLLDEKSFQCRKGQPSVFLKVKKRVR